jgi:hypothetical protein
MDKNPQPQQRRKINEGHHSSRNEINVAVHPEPSVDVFKFLQVSTFHVNMVILTWNSIWALLREQGQWCVRLAWQ